MLVRNITKSSRLLAVASRNYMMHPGVPHAKLAETQQEQPEVFEKAPVRETLLADRTALVTNCDTTEGGLAKNVAVALASYGANVLVHGEQEPELSALLNELPVHHSKQRHAFLVDKLDDDLTVDIGEKVKQFTDHLDVLVHNTGSIHLPKSEDVANCDVAEFDDVVRQSLTTPYALFQSLLPLISAGKNPSIIFCSTTPEMDEHDVIDHDSTYFVSKFGFNSSRMLTKMLAGSLAKKNIRVNAVDPGRFLSHENEEKALAGRSEFAKTSAFVWLARPDTVMTGSQLDAMQWIRRDPIMFKSFY